MGTINGDTVMVKGAEMLHKNIVPGDQHVVHNWEYADEAARVAATGFTAADLKKLAYQIDTNTLWILTLIGPTWVPVGTLTEKTFPYPDDTIRVSTTGNDSTADGSAAAPFLTIQAAVDYASEFAWRNGRYPIISVAAGTYTGNVQAMPLALYAQNMTDYSMPCPVIRGDVSTPTNVVVTGSFYSRTPTPWKIEGIYINPTTTGRCVEASWNGKWRIGRVRLGGNDTAWWTGFKVLAWNEGQVMMDGGQIDVSSNANAIFAAYLKGQIDFYASPVINHTTAITVTQYVLSHLLAAVVLDAVVTFTGSAVTGSKYNVMANSVLSLKGVTFPGSTAGTVTLGGQVF